MPFKVVRNDITHMHTDAIVNTANPEPEVGPGCDAAIYQAAGYEQLLAYRREHIGPVPEGEVFVTPAFSLPMKVIIHAVSPLYQGGTEEEEAKLRACYQKSLAKAKELGLSSIAFPLISAGSFGYPQEEAMSIAADEIREFLKTEDMLVYLVVFGDRATKLGTLLYPDLEAYIDSHYVEISQPVRVTRRRVFRNSEPMNSAKRPEPIHPMESAPSSAPFYEAPTKEVFCDSMEAIHSFALDERLRHLSDTFSEYLLYLIQNKNMENAEVYKRALVDKKTFSKIKNNPEYHPQKLTALCLCVGAKLNMDETRDLLARAGYALSPCDKTDVIFSYFIEKQIYDMIELDILLEEYGLPCIIA